MEDTLLSNLNDTLARLANATESLLAAQPVVEKIVAETDANLMRELMSRLEAIEEKLATFTARKTITAGAASMQSKQPETTATIDATAIDAALSSLSIEQRIAVKADLLRAGILS